MTIPHSTLTGSDLHEVKGASTATVGQVPVANGSGSAIFALLTASSLTGTGNPFGNNLLHVREEQPSNTSSATASVWNAFNTVVLNTTKTNEISSASLSSNQITLPAGTYYIEALVPYLVVKTACFGVTRLQNITTSTTLINGTSVKLVNTGQASGYAFLRGRFTLTGTTVLELQSYRNDNSSGTSIGATTGVATEVYSDLQIWKVL